MKKQTAMWTTRNGARLRICDMEDRHLVNTLRMLRRAHGELVSSAWAAACSLQGEMASYYAEQDIDRLEQVESTHPLFGRLEMEALRRGLKWK